MNELDVPISRATGSTPVRYRRSAGGYSSADRFVVALADGRQVFVKSAVADNLARWLRREHEVYSSLCGAFIPEPIGWDDDGTRPVLVLEDLSGADWAARWDRDRIAAVRAALEELATQTAPAGTTTVRETFPDLLGRWHEVAADPAPFLSLGLRDSAWLNDRLPAILDAADGAPIDGDALCHLDVRSDNICLRDACAVLVDWNWLSFANPELDLVAWLPSVRVEGGPPPWEVIPGDGRLVAFVAGVWAAVTGLPAPATAPTVRAIQRAQLAVALDWLDRVL